MKKILIIENDYLDRIKIQAKLIPYGYHSSLPFAGNESPEKKQNKNIFLREESSSNKTVIAKDCLTDEELQFVELLDGAENINDAKCEIRRIIESNYRELRLIVCDLQICGSDQGGNEIIDFLRSTTCEDRISIENKPWFMQEIPIIVATKLDGQEAFKAYHWKNCFPVKKQDVFTSSASGFIKQFIEKEASAFDDYYNKKSQQRQYKVALSFTGRKGTELHRKFVEEIAHQLYAKYTEDKVFYDVDKLKTGRNVGLTKEDFTRIYSNDCEYIIVCLSQDYASKESPWTMKEWEGIKHYCSVSHKKVIFILIGDNVSQESVKLSLGVDPGLWIPADKIRKDFYNAIEGKTIVQDKVKKEMMRFESTIYNYSEVCYDEYKKACKMIADDVIPSIIGHITNVDNGIK